MAVSLSSSHSFLANCSGEYLTFNCSKYPKECQEYPNQASSVSYPFFNVSGHAMTAELKFGDSFKASNLNMTYATTCGSNNNLNQGKIYGVLGMGIDNGNECNFQNTKSFSIFLDSGSGDGELILGEDGYKEVGGT
mmetsp:Transcript_9867/g.8411  ORF Transcript_9867/g.8411 Transcript_9867/m.8411 type:complete len:136 (-) Transcript_9867:705-1112(-)